MNTPKNVHPLLADIPWDAALCFTGHRPEKLPRDEAQVEGLILALRHNIVLAVRLGYKYFFTGMADGIDYYAARILFEFRKARPELFVIGVQPCEDYEEFFRSRHYSLEHLHEMVEKVDRHIILPGSYRDNHIFLKRNDVMVDHSSGIIAVCDNGRSGSAHTFSYAKSKGLSYCRIIPRPPAGTIPSPENWPTEKKDFTL